MEFNFSTFVLEIINFLILIWILQRLFYKPVLAVITRRKQYIDQTLAEAQSMKQEAEDLRQRYENRQNQWQQEKQAALSALHREIDAERKTQMDKLRADLEQERQKAKVTLTRLQQDIQQQAEKKALQNGARFAGLLLQQAAGPELEQRLCAMLLEHFTDLPEECRLCLQTLDAEALVSIDVSSAYPLPTGLRQKLEQKLGSLIKRPDVFHYHQNPELIAGLRIDIGAWVMHANLQHELTGFAEIAHESE
ncbi:F0F1 ATP synthase subunit delta [Methylobacter sp. BBA5.1]|jgi:F-type H+-transporting ATPase subunit b|uniref:F0F1 ATP synthase subunit delta n=1 Tax=Methylobacter sp. BBA5.1 TaxID=1495064 RepID=UPI0005625FFC|nr:F0F1 ATP synthase subunit delta [Methylobacter sp. BBA5.1]